MEANLISEKLRRLEISGRVEIANGHGGLPLVKITTPWSTAEIYLHGAHVTHFQKNGEPPLIFMSAKSYFAPGTAIRGGVPVCFPWFGNRNGEPSHGFARLTEWQLVKTSAAPDGAVTLQFALPGIPGQSNWNSLRTEFMVTVSETLTMELTTSNDSCDGTPEIENCLHTYFHVGDIGAVSFTGLRDAPFNDFAASDTGTRKVENDSVLRITKETNRVYPDNTATVEIIDEKLKRTIRVEKFNSKSTVVWNPWTTQKLPDDFDPAEHKNMVCVESGNVKQNKISLAPGKTTVLKVVLSSALLQ
ncbi:MAG TPA: D-hexose-6-phosphate mutarotase [Verrucomicrobiae bacterium]|jgi:D-hexose-6-phosphate mutarotase